MNWQLLQKDELPGLDQDLSALNEHGVAGYVYSKFYGDAKHQAKALRPEWLRQLSRNLIYQKQLQTISSLYEAAGVRAVVLKGMALLDDIYDDVGARNISDIDLLIDPAQWQASISILEAAGYEKVDSDHWEADDFKLVLSQRLDGIDVIVELHQRLFYSEANDPIDWQYRKTQGGFYALAMEDNLVHLLGHLGYQHTFIKLSWLVDIDLYIRKYGDQLSWGRVWWLCERLGQTRSARSAIYACQKYLKTPIPKVAGEVKSGWLMKKLLGSAFLWNPAENRIHYYLVKHYLKDSIWHALKYDLLWLARGVWKR